MRDISNELKSTISTMAVMQSCSTDIGQTISITGSFLIWVHNGLVSKYGRQLMGADEDIRMLMEDISSELRDGEEYINNPYCLDAQWLQAINAYNTSRQYWGLALRICHDVAKVCNAICVSENMLDYDAVNTSVTDAYNKMIIKDTDDDSLEIKKPKPITNIEEE